MKKWTAIVLCIALTLISVSVPAEEMNERNESEMEIAAEASEVLGTEPQPDEETGEPSNTIIWEKSMVKINDNAEVITNDNAEEVMTEAEEELPMPGKSGNEAINSDKSLSKNESNEEASDVSLNHQASEICGKNVMWTISDEGILNIFGQGAMYDYTADDPAPWYDDRVSITKVIIDEGVTSIGEWAFYGFENVNSIVLADSIDSIGHDAFSECDELENIYYHGEKQNWEDIMYLQHDILTDAISDEDAVTLFASDGKYIWPVSTSYRITAGWTYPSSGNFHGATDFGVPVGTNVSAIAGGTVRTATYHSSWGNYIVIDHGGNVYSLYAHLKSGGIAVSVGQTVSQGQVIGYSGATGNVTGPHLHLELWMGGYGTSYRVDPQNYLTKTNTPVDPYYEINAYYICTDPEYLNLREGPGTGYSVIETIPSGATVFVFEATGEGSGHWALITYEGTQGYASMAYLRKRDTTPRITTDTTSVSLKVPGNETQTVIIKGIEEDTSTMIVKYKKSGSGFTVEWGQKEWKMYEGALYHKLIITGTASGSGTINVSLQRRDDGSILSSKTINVSVSADSYTVLFDCNGGTLIKDGVSYDDGGRAANMPKGKKLELATVSNYMSRDGYTLIGWNTKADGTGTSYSTTDTYTVTKSETLYAQWRANTYIISYNANGGIGAPLSQTQVYGESLTLSSTKPTRTGYDFTGWNTKADGSGKSYSSGDSYLVTEKLYLYAQWKIKTYYITINANGGRFGEKGPVMASGTKEYGKDFIIPELFAPIRTGYTFIGFNTKEDGSGTSYNVGSVYSSNANLFLYAQWKENIYTITYNANGGSGAPSNQTKIHGITLTLSDTQPTRSGYTFLGWSTSSSATSATYSVESSFRENADTTLYAVWKLSNVDVVTAVTLNKSSISLTEGEKTTLSATVYPSNATNKTVTWTSSNTSVATVNSYGTVTAKSSGTAKITASAGGKSASCTVTVKTETIEVTSVSISPSSKNMEVGEKATLSASVYPSNATNKTVTWSSSNTSVATVSNGVVTAKASGTATITATANGVRGRCLVTVTKAKNYNVTVYTEAPSNVSKGHTFDFKVYFEGTYDGYSFKVLPGNGMTITNVVGATSGVNVDRWDDGSWQVSVMGALGKVSSGKEKIATITVKVADNAQLGNRELALDELMISNEYGDREASVYEKYANITITNSIPGDINGDGKFDYYDVTKLYAIYRRKAEPSKEVDTDINRDGKFDYYDVTKLYAIYRKKANFN